MERVSIVVPIFNMADSIERCVKSLLKQDYENLEIILVDDGSEDETLSVCQRLSKADARIKIYHTENRGSGPARNFGISMASGKYIYFPDADDYLEPTGISGMVRAMCNGTELVVFGYKKVNQKNDVVAVKKFGDRVEAGSVLRADYGQCVNALKPWAIQGAPWNKFFDLSVIRENNVEFPPLRRHQDEGFISRYMCYVKQVRFIPDVLYTHYINDLKLVWKKFPVDYMDAVIGLYRIRKETILTWNSEDKLTRDMVLKEYICYAIRALELTFSPKNGFKNKQQRTEWIEKLIAESAIDRYEMPERFKMRYQRRILSFIKKKQINRLYYAFKLKAYAEMKLSGVFGKPL